MLFRSNAFVCNSEGACEVPIVGPYMIATFVIIGFVILVFIIVISVVASKNKKNRQKRKNREAAKSERKMETQPLRAADPEAAGTLNCEALHLFCVLHTRGIDMTANMALKTIMTRNFLDRAKKSKIINNN